MGQVFREILEEVGLEVGSEEGGFWEWLSVSLDLNTFPSLYSSDSHTFFRTLCRYSFQVLMSGFLLTRLSLLSLPHHTFMAGPCPALGVRDSEVTKVKSRALVGSQSVVGYRSWRWGWGQ